MQQPFTAEKGETMKRNNVWIAGLALAGFLALAPAAHAGVWVGLRVGPPPPRHEYFVERPGRVWVGGHWGWNHARYYWVPGGYIERRHGHVWEDGGWRHGHRGWAYHEGHWRRH